MSTFCVYFSLHMCVELYCRVIIEHMINMAAASKTGIMFKFLSFQENLNNINKVDATSNVPCKKILEELKISV